MFGIVDMIVVAGIQDALKHLSVNPTHIEFILGQFCQGPIKNLVGEKYIKDCIDLIQKNRIEVGPYYQMDHKMRPGVSVVASYAESQQYIGDEGSFQYAQTLPAKTYMTLNAKKAKGCHLYISAEEKIEDKLWISLILKNGDITRIIKGILVREGEDTQIFLDKELPKNVKLSGWKVQSDVKESGYVINASTDDVTIQLNLQTLGDYSVHRLLATVIRYCLKKQRLWFDQYGLQVATYSQTPPLLTEENENEFQTVFTINGKFTDSWIVSEVDLPDSTANIDFGLIAHSDVLPNEREDVPLE